MSEVVVKYHHEPEGWWAESDDVPRFSAAAATYGEVVDQVRMALPGILGVADPDLRELIVVDPVIAITNIQTLSPMISLGAPLGAASPVPRTRRVHLLASLKPMILRSSESPAGSS